MSARRYKARLLLGAILAAGAVALVLFAIFKPEPFSGATTVRAVFSDATGIAPVGADVRIAGTPVGKVESIERRGDEAVVTMSVEADAGPIHRDAHAELRPNLPFEGTAYVDLEPGTPGAEELPSDGEVAVEATAVYVPLDEALRTFGDEQRAGLQTSLRALARGLAPAPADAANRLLGKAPELTAGAARVAGAAGGSDGDELAGAVDGLAGTSAAIAAHRESLPPLLTATERTLTALETDGSAPLGASIDALPETLVKLERGGRTLDDVVARLDPLATALEPGLEQLAPTLEGARPLLEQARPALEAARPLIADAKVALQQGAAATPATRELIKAVHPTVSTLRDSLVPALLKPTDELNVPAYISFLNLFGGGGGASAPFQTDEQANPPLQPETGHFMRFGLRFLTGFGAPLPPCALLELANPQLAAALSAAGGCTP